MQSMTCLFIYKFFYIGLLTKTAFKPHPKQFEFQTAKTLDRLDYQKRYVDFCARFSHASLLGLQPNRLSPRLNQILNL